MTYARFILLFAITLFAFACTNSRVLIGEHDGGVRDGGGATPCGPATCEPGTVCCNESCGYCVAPGGSCTEEYCEPISCGGERCPATTTQCCPGCPGESASCAGPGGECPAIACPGCPSEGACDDDEVCCPTCDDAFICAPRDAGCPDIACPPPVCATADDCEEGTCCRDCTTGERYCAAGPCATCPEPGRCSPMDAAGEGPCDAELGVAYDGATCQSISGCRCVGTDCERLYESREACFEATWECLPTCTSDAECDVHQWCDGCARGSCPLCADCVQACAPGRCATGEPLTCRAVRPECGANGTAIVVDGCWQCVDAYTCDPLEAGDCRATGCPDRHSCTACRVGEPWVCLPPDLACAL